MDASPNQRIGHYKVATFCDEKVRAYVPQPLPPDPPLRMDGLQVLLAEAGTALGRLDGFASVLPNPDQFLYSYVRREALLSSQIEGTQSSLSDLLLYESQEAPGVPTSDVGEVVNYVAALQHGLHRLQKDKFPLSLRLLKEVHGILLDGARGSEKQPGEFRTSQNWIGGSRPGNAAFVPPPPEDVIACMSDLEKFLHLERPDLPVFVKAALAHVQFETIHPFLDGNGRLGRLLITLLLCSEGVLQQPILYLSLYLKTHRQRYYDLLTEVRETGNWESWLEFFLIGIRETAEGAVETARRIIALLDEDRLSVERLGRPSSSALRLLQYVQKYPIFGIAAASRATGMSEPTVGSATAHLVRLGMLEEVTGRQRKRIFVNRRYVDILSEGTEPLRPGT
jgi:Fic family protein